MRFYDNRRYWRVDVDFPILIQVGPDSPSRWAARAVNLCAGGILIQSDQLLRVNALFVLRFPEDWQRTFILATVVRRNGEDYGCKFIDLPQGVYKLLEQTAFA